MAKAEIESLLNVARQQVGAEVYYREDWGCYYFSLLGKAFGMLSSEYLTLKGPPEENELLRQMYHDIIPGYHTNKVHWNSVVVGTSEVPLALQQELIVTSYQLVFRKLSKKEQRVVEEKQTKTPPQKD